MIINVLIANQLEKKNCSESDSNDIVLLRRYRYSCSVGLTIFKELEQLLLYTRYFKVNNYNDNYILST